MIIPHVGDIWEIKLPGKPKKQKEIGTIGMVWVQRENGTEVRRPYVHWDRLPKGRYSGIRVKWLLKYGKRISTKAERDAHFRSLIAKAKARREALSK